MTMSMKPLRLPQQGAGDFQCQQHLPCVESCANSLLVPHLQATWSSKGKCRRCGVTASPAQLLRGYGGALQQLTLQLFSKPLPGLVLMIPLTRLQAGAASHGWCTACTSNASPAGQPIESCHH